MKKCLFRLTARALGVLAAGAAAAPAASTATASAALIETGACGAAAFSEPFAPWGDRNQYELVQGGSFESGATGWKLTGGAAVAAGSEPFAATGALGSRSLFLPPGASAESPPTCVNAAYPTFRLFARSSGPLSTATAQVVYTDPIAGRLALPVGVIGIASGWKPTLPMLTTSAIQSVLKNGAAQVSLRFTALTGATTIDDVYVDPRLSH